jgi:predicted peptidase
MIKPSFLALALLLGSNIPSLHSQDETPTNQKAESFERTITQTVGADYLLFLPKGYDAEEGKRWPLILFLHGAGERGTNIHLVTKHGPPKLVQDQEKSDFPFVVVSPQCPDGATWSNDLLLALLDEVTGKHAVDTNRIYLTGLSMGGYGTWSLGLSHPDRFAAIAPICGGGDLITILLPGQRTARALRALPVWAFHGAKDELVKLSESERMVNALRRIGNDAKLTIYPEAGHDSWTETYNNPELYGWFLRHSKVTGTADSR